MNSSYQAVISAAIVAVAGIGGGTARAHAERQAPSGGVVPVVVIVMENKPYSAILGNKHAPFINGTMIANGALYTNYVAAPGSLPDYLMMVSGKDTPRASAPNLFADLGTATSWREFEESMPSACYSSSGYGKVPGTSVPLYTKTHNPAMQFTSVTSTSLCNKVVPLNAHFDATALPAFSYVVPNECDDMHTLPATGRCPMWNGGTNTASSQIQMGDNWLASFVPAISKSATVILTWDEGSSTSEQVVTVAYGAGVSAKRDGRAYTHASLEAGLYSYFGLGKAPGAGKTARPLPIP